MKVSGVSFTPCVISVQRRKVMYKPCAVCGLDVNTRDHHVVLEHIVMHSECFSAVRTGEARGSLGEEVIPPELLARAGLL